MQKLDKPFDRYHVSMLGEIEVQEFPKAGSYIRIDVGLKNFVILSDRTLYKNPKFIWSLEEKLEKVQGVLSRRIKESSRWNTQRVKVAGIREYMINARKDYLSFHQKPRCYRYRGSSGIEYVKES